RTHHPRHHFRRRQRVRPRQLGSTNVTLVSPHRLKHPRERLLLTGKHRVSQSLIIPKQRPQATGLIRQELQVGRHTHTDIRQAETDHRRVSLRVREQHRRLHPTVETVKEVSRVATHEHIRIRHTQESQVTRDLELAQLSQSRRRIRRQPEEPRLTTTIRQHLSEGADKARYQQQVLRSLTRLHAKRNLLPLLGHEPRTNLTNDQLNSIHQALPPGEPRSEGQTLG